MTMENCLQVCEILLVLMLPVIVTQATIVQNKFEKLDSEQNITGKIGAEIKARSRRECAVRQVLTTPQNNISFVQQSPLPLCNQDQYQYFQIRPVNLVHAGKGSSIFYITARNEVGARKYFQKRVSRILSTGGGLQAHTQGGRLRGLAWGVSKSTPRGGVKCQGPGLGGVS